MSSTLIKLKKMMKDDHVRLWASHLNNNNEPELNNNKEPTKFICHKINAKKTTVSAC